MKKIICSGSLFYAINTQRFLLLYRTQSKQKNVWGLVGGTNLENETPWEGLNREILEEIGLLPPIVKAVPLESFISNDDHFLYHTYLCLINEEFIPILNTEHSGYAWVSLHNWPKPLHQGLANTLKNKTNLIKIETVLSLYKKD